MMNFIPYITALLAAFIGIGAIITFTVFIYIGPFHLVDLSFNNTELLLFDAFLAFIFFLQHSLMVRPWFKQSVINLLPQAYFGAVFSIASGLVLFTLLALWQESSVIIISSAGAWRWIIRMAFFIVIVIQTWALWSLKSVDLFGIHALVSKSKTVVSPVEEAILITGAYRWVRHPIYTTSILLIWLYPNVTADRLLLNVMFTIWIIIGTWCEERDLLRIHGETYRNYQRVVPMLIPYKKSRKPN